MSHIREEFEKAFSEFGVKPEDSYVGWKRAIWGAKWMAEYMAQDAIKRSPIEIGDVKIHYLTATQMREHSKDLSQ